MSNGAFFNGEVFVFGGYDENNCQVDSCEKFNLARNLWIDLVRLPEKIGYSTSVTVDKKIFVTGKFSSKVLSYNPPKNQFRESLNVGKDYKVLLGN